MPRMIIMSFALLMFAASSSFAQTQLAPMGNDWFDSMLTEVGNIYGDDTPTVIVRGGDDDGGEGTGTDGSGPDNTVPDVAGDGGTDEDTDTAGSPNPQDPEVAALIREWLNTAIPEDNAKGGRLYYDPYGRLLGTSSGGTIITANGPPYPLSGPTPEAHAWAVSRKLGSLNLCTMEEFVALRLSSASTAHCHVGVPGPPVVVASTPPTQPMPPDTAPGPPPAVSVAPVPPTLTTAEKCEQEISGSAPLELGPGLTVCACPQGQKLDKASKSCISPSSAGPTVASLTPEQECTSQTSGSVPNWNGDNYVCRCPNDLERRDGRCVPKSGGVPSPAQGAAHLRLGQYSCRGGWGGMVLTDTGPGYASGYYTGTFDKSATGTIKIFYNSLGGRWVGKWAEPKVGRRGFTKNEEISNTRISAQWGVYQGAEGIYQGRALPNRSGSLTCSWASALDPATAGNNLPPQSQPPQPVPRVSSGAPGEERIDKSRKAYYVVKKSGKGWRKKFGGYGQYSDGYHLFILQYDPKAKGIGGSYYTRIGGDQSINAVFAQWQSRAREGTGKSCRGDIPLCPCRPGPDIYVDGPHYEIIAGPFDSGTDAKNGYQCEKKARGTICNRWNTQSIAGGYKDVVATCKRLGH